MRQPVTLCPQEAEREMLAIAPLAFPLYLVRDPGLWDGAAHI